MSNSMATRARSHHHHHRGGRSSHSGGMNNRPNNHTRGGRPEPREPKTDKTAIAGIHANPRLMHAFMQMVGSKVTVTTKNGQKYSGLLNSVNRDGNIVLSGATCVSDDNPNSPAAQDLENIIVEKENIVTLVSKALELDTGRSPAEFATDHVIAQRSNGQIAGEKELEPWDGGDDDVHTHETLEASSDANGWAAEDMFQCNEEKFCLRSSYNKDLNEYTTPLPAVKDETYRRREQEAARKAQEIEDSEQSRKRYELENGDEDEESKYSAVHRPPGAGGMRDLGGGPGKSKSSQGYAKRPGGIPRGGRQQHMDGGRGLQTRSVPQPQPPTPRSPPKIDNPPRVNGSRNEAHTADMSRSMGEMPAVSASVPSTLAQGPGPQPSQNQPPQSTPSLSSSQLPPQSQAAQAPSAGTQVQPPLPHSQPQPSPPIQPQPAASAPSQVKSPSTAALGGGDSAKEAITSSEGAQAAPTTGAAAVARTTKTGEFISFAKNFIIKYNQEGLEGEPAGASTPKEGGATAKEEEPQAEKGATAVEGEKPVEKKKYVLNPNAEEFKPQSKPMPPPAVSQAPTPPRPSLPQSPSVMMSQQPAYMGSYVPYTPGPMPGAPPQPKPARSNQYPQRAVVSMTQPTGRQDFSAAAQHATGAPLMAQAAPHQFNHHPPYLLPTHPFPQQNMPMLSPHPTRVMNPTSMSLTHQTMQPGADPMQATSQHAMNPQHQHVFMPPHGAPIPAHLPSHVPMPAHVPHGMAGQQSQAMQPMTPVTGPPNPGSVQHSVGGHQQPPPTSGTPQPGPMNYAHQINLPSHLGHQNQHTTSPQPMQPYGMATSHAQPQQHLQHGGQQYTFAQQSQPASSQAMQPYGSSQPGQHHPTLVVMPPLGNHLGHQFGSHVPMPAHANATPVMPVHSGIPASAASGLSHPHMPFLPHHSQVATQHGHQVPGYPQNQ